MESHAFGSENSDTENKDYSLSCGSSSFGNSKPCLCGEITDSLSDDVGKEVRDVIHVLWCG
jgi:hypothetical protein